jgi:hypothetical protein
MSKIAKTTVQKGNKCGAVKLALTRDSASRHELKALVVGNYGVEIYMH